MFLLTSHIHSPFWTHCTYKHRLTTYVVWHSILFSLQVASWTPQGAQRHHNLGTHKALVYSKNGNNWNATTIETVNSPHNLRRCGWTRPQLAKLAGELALNFVAGNTLRVNSPPNLRRCGWTRPITWDVAGEFVRVYTVLLTICYQ